MSIIILALNWLAEFNYKEKLQLFAANRPAIVLTLIFALNVLGILWSYDPLFSLTKTLHHKLPTLLLPIIIVTSPILSNRQIRFLLLLFVSSVLMVTLIGLVLRVTQNPINFREASPFIPATNFTMLLILSAFQLPLLVRQISDRKIHFYLSLGVSLWFIIFIFYLRSFSGLASLVGVMAYTFIVTVFHHRSLILKASFAIVSIAFIALGIWLFAYMYNLTHLEVETDLTELPSHTKYGGAYHHDTLEVLRENGHLVNIYIADAELYEAWSERSSIDFNGLDLNNEYLKYTLYRYMASKGLTKDKEGFSSLTNKDIEAVEKGITNHLYLEWPGIFTRVHMLMMGVYMYTNSPDKDPTWSTLTKRLELWKASWHAFKTKPLLGWGTGQIENAVEFGLRHNNSAMAGSNIRSHNQYLSLLLLWGVLGLIAFFTLIAYFIFKSNLHKVFIFNIFLITLAINGLVNDPIEGQIGQSLFVFFSLFYYHFYLRLKTNNPFVF